MAHKRSNKLYYLTNELYCLDLGFIRPGLLQRFTNFNMTHKPEGELIGQGSVKRCKTPTQDPLCAMGLGRNELLPKRDQYRCRDQSQRLRAQR